MATSTSSIIATLTYSGRWGDSTLVISDLEGEASLVDDLELAGPPIIEYFSKTQQYRIGMIPSFMEIPFVGDEARVFRSLLDGMSDAGRYQAEYTQPLGDGSSGTWIGFLNSTYFPTPLNQDQFPVGDFVVRARDGLAATKDVHEPRGTVDGLPAANVYPRQKKIWQVFHTMKTAFHSTLPFKSIRGFTTITFPGLGTLNWAAMRFVHVEERLTKTTMTEVDQILNLFGMVMFQPMSATAPDGPEIWAIPRTRTGLPANATTVDLTDQSGHGSGHVFREMGERQIALGFEDWNGELDDAFSTVEPAGEIRFENDSVLGQLIAFPNFSSLTGAGDPLGWTRLGATAGNSDAEGRYVLEQNEWYRTKLIRLPNLTGVSVRMDIDQLGWAPTGDDFTVGLGTGGFSYSGANGKFYVPDGDVWRETLSPDANGEGNIFGTWPSPNAYRVTPALPNVGGGTLYAYAYGGSVAAGPGVHAAFSRVEAELVETSTGDSVETLLTVFERDDNIASATVTLPLVTEWEYRINPGFDQFQEMTAFQSLITGETYFDFSQCVAKERHSVHTRLRYIDATIDGIYSPEFRFTFEASDETSFDTDIVASLVFARLDPKTGQTSGVFLEILET